MERVEKECINQSTPPNKIVPITVNTILALVCGLIANIPGYLIISNSMFDGSYWYYPSIISLSIFFWINVLIAVFIIYISNKASNKKYNSKIYIFLFTIPSFIIAIIEYIILKQKTLETDIPYYHSSRSSSEQLLLDNFHNGQIYLLQTVAILLLLVVLDMFLKKYEKKPLCILLGALMSYIPFALLSLILILSESLTLVVITEIILSLAIGFAIVIFINRIQTSDETQNYKICSTCIKVTMLTLNIGAIVLLYLMIDNDSTTGWRSFDYLLLIICIVIHTIFQFLLIRIAKHEMQ